MKLNRRNTLIGLGAVATGAGAAFGSGAFTTVEAERTVSVETADDANAFLALAPGANAEYVDDAGDTIEIQLDGDSDAGGDGLSQNAVNTFEDLVEVTNQGTQDVTSLTLELTDSADSADDSTFSFPVSGDDAVGGPVGNNDEILDTNLSTSASVSFGLEVDLIDGGDQGDLTDTSYTLTITAETS